MNDKPRKIGIWAESSFAIYSSIPIVNKYLRKNYELIFYTNRANKKMSDELFGSSGVKVLDFTAISSKQNVIGSWITKNLFITFLVSPKFSEDYERHLTRSMSKFNLKLNRLLSIFHVPNRLVNKLFHRISYLFYSLGLLTSVVEDDIEILIAFTHNYYPFYLAPSANKTILIVDSWDHPPKRPFYLYPNKCLVWNKDLKSDVKKYQNLNYVGLIKPGKFNYIEERKQLPEKEIFDKLPVELQEDLKFLKENETVVYPVCLPKGQLIEDEETKFISYLAEILHLRNRKLYIRPYPQASPSDMKELEKLPNCKVGYVKYSSGANHLFDRNSIDHKYLVLKYAQKIVNIGTTFVFDAALAGTDVSQVIIDTNKFGDKLRQVSGFSHIDNYLNTKFAFKLNAYNESDFIEYILTPDPQLKNYFTNWLLNKDSPPCNMNIYEK